MTEPLQSGAYYHIYNRGNNGENIFKEERNYFHFLKLYAKHIVPVADTFAYCLMRNHFHLMIRTHTFVEQVDHWRSLPDKQKDLSGFQNLTGLNELQHDFTNLSSLSNFKPLDPSQCFSNLFNAYTKAINKAYKRTGSLFQRPFGRVQVTSRAHFRRLLVYIHQNPQNHGFVKDFRTWPYSSYQTLCSLKQTNLRRDDILTWFENWTYFRQAHSYQIEQHQLIYLVPEEFDDSN